MRGGIQGRCVVWQEETVFQLTNGLTEQANYTYQLVTRKQESG